MTVQPHVPRSDPWAGAWDKCENRHCECRSEDAISTPLTAKEDIE